MMTAQLYSPRPWGWTGHAPRSPNTASVFPTPVGMDRGDALQTTQVIGIPHARGDGPVPRAKVCAACAYSPRPWGWTDAATCRVHSLVVFPTPVGMDRLMKKISRASRRIPHARGDGPCAVNSLRKLLAYSPRPWGWTGLRERQRSQRYVFPTPVGMDRLQRGLCVEDGSIPHARGDGPAHVFVLPCPCTYSPRPWGWTAGVPQEGIDGSVFPTPVGMDRKSPSVLEAPGGIPHARGDGP